MTVFISNIIKVYAGKKDPEEFMCFLKYESGQWFSRTRWFNDGFVSNQRWEKITTPSQYTLTQLFEYLDVS